MINLLYLTGMFPYDQEQASGIFVTRRIERLILNKRVNLKVVALVSQYNSLARIIKRGLPNRTVTKTQNIYDFYDYLYYKLNFIDYLLELCSKGDAYKHIASGFFNLLKQHHDFSKYNLIHAHFVQLAGFVANDIYENYGLPYIITAHGSDIHTNPLKDSNTREHTIEVLEKAATLIFVSKSLLNTARVLGYSGNNAVVIPNGVDTNKFMPLERDVSRRKLTSYKKGNFLIGYVGRLIPIKGIYFLPKIFENIKNIVGNVQFLVVGDGCLKQYILEKCKEKKLDVIFTGRVSQDELVFLYNSMDTLIVPSLNEGYSCVALEAQACGIPVVGSNVGGIPEAIGGKDFGEVVDLGSNFEKRFASAVVEVLDSKLSVNKLRARTLNFSWEKIVEKEFEIYKKVLNHRIVK